MFLWAFNFFLGHSVLHIMVDNENKMRIDVLLFLYL